MFVKTQSAGRDIWLNTTLVIAVKAVTPSTCHVVTAGEGSITVQESAEDLVQRLAGQE